MRMAARSAWILFLFSFVIASFGQPSGRTIRLRYEASVTEIPAGTRLLRVWLPLPGDTPQQRVSGLTLHGDGEGRVHVESVYSNRMVFFEQLDPAAEYALGFTCVVQRFEDDGAHGLPEVIPPFRAANALVPISPEIGSMAKAITREETRALDCGRRFYEHVLREMTYDKSGEGWGRGDFKYACDIRRGNCSDFHSYFIGLCRNAGIPAYFEIGISVPVSSGKAGGYHCWAYFRADERWVPVDISEADKAPERAEHFFGHHDADRIAFTRGRDLVLEPRQSGAPLNFFIDPYAEADGTPVRARKETFCEFDVLSAD